MENASQLYHSNRSSNQSQPESDAPQSDESMFFDIAKIVFGGRDTRSEREEKRTFDSSRAVQQCPWMVTINSSSDFASSGLVGFQLIPQNGSNVHKEAKKAVSMKISHCQYCRYRSGLEHRFLTHSLKDPVTKRVICPVLRIHVCEICGSTGDLAHTAEHCPRRLSRKAPQTNYQQAPPFDKTGNGCRKLENRLGCHWA